MHDFLLFLLQEARLLALCIFNPLTSILHKNRHTSFTVSQHLHLCLARDEGCVGNEVCGYQGLGNRIFFHPERDWLERFSASYIMQSWSRHSGKKKTKLGLIMPSKLFRQISSSTSDLASEKFKLQHICVGWDAKSFLCSAKHIWHVWNMSTKYIDMAWVHWRFCRHETTPTPDLHCPS